MIEKEYYVYLNQTWQECCQAAGLADKDLAKLFFDKAASPHYNWLQNRALSDQTSKGLPMVTVSLFDGELKTIDYKDSIKKEAFHWDSQNKCWWRTLAARDWETLGKQEPFSRLKAEVKEEKKP